MHAKRVVSHIFIVETYTINIFENAMLLPGNAAVWE